VLEVVLLLAGRQQITVAKKLVDTRNKVAEILEQIDLLVGREAVTGGPRSERPL
jgi:hypothetical protein